MPVYQPTEAEILDQAIDAKLLAVGKALPGTVVSYNATTKTCVVRPGVNRPVPSADLDEPEDFEELPALQAVPVMWPRAVGFVLEGSLSAGDTVFLVCCDRDISEWRRTGQPSNPNDPRRHSWGSVVAIPGLIPDTNPFPTPGDAAALASRVEAELSDLRDTVNALRAAFVAHKHTGVVTGIAVSGPPDPATPPAAPAAHPPIGSTGSTILLLKE